MQPDLEFVFRPEIHAIFDHFCALLGIRIALLTPAGQELRIGARRPMCVYCRLLRKDPAWDVKCRKLDAAAREQAAQSGSKTVYACHGGMLEAVMPVCISGRLLGFAMIGQFRQKAAPPAAILSNLDANRRTRLKQAYLQVPFYSPEKSRHAVGLFETLVQYIAESRLIDRQDLIGSILDRFRDKPGKRLPLKQAANLAGCSPSQFSRLFRKMAGRSYERTRIDLLLEKADELLRLRPRLRIQEIAFRLGFDDPLYFSRIYRKHRGQSPSAGRGEEVRAKDAKDAKGRKIQKI